ncbi:MAG: rhodanese-like domain-containing protein [Flavobacteriales bacterium]|jgi:rhodanese-related sulfurtransferase|nr:rhodanese-like domain-containing protein [Flavobacteriales bacterium]
MKNIILSLSVIAILAVPSCGEITAQENNDNKIEVLSSKDFKSKLAGLKDYQLIDVRTPGECENGVIDGAININFQASDFEEKIASLDKTKPTLVYCAGGVRSAQAAKKMSKMGFVQIIDLKGGYSSWYE